MENTAALATPPPVSPLDFSGTERLLEEAVAQGVFPGAVFVVSQGGQVQYQRSVGQRTLVTPPADPASPAPSAAAAAMKLDTVFDIAGLTGTMATAALVMKLVQEGRLRLDDRASRYLQGFGVLGKSPITIGQLLAHTSGLGAWHPFFEDLLREHSGARLGILTSRAARDYVINGINRSVLKGEIGARQVYSDLGLIVLGHVVELLTGLGLEKAFQRLVAQPLGLKSSSFIDLGLIRRRGILPVTDLIAPTEECPWRERVLCGEVHDDNAWAMGGIAGHSGLFCNAMDLQLFGAEMLRAYHGQSAFLAAETVHFFWSQPAVPGIGSWRLGWDTPSKENGMLGVGFGPRAVGVNGFTGCSLWLDPDRDAVLVLLSNRIHPSRSNKKIMALRPELHRSVLQGVLQVAAKNA